MVNQSILSLLLLPALALGAPHVQRREYKPSITTTVATSPVATATPSNTPSAKAGQVFFKNNCSYDVTVEPIPGPGCSAKSGSTVAAGSTWADQLTDCAAGNTALKVYKEGSTKPMQFEYGLQGGNVWYDMSFINCLAAGYDFSSCAGTGWSMSSMSNCKAYACSSGEFCCTQGYCDPDGSAVSPAPNCACGANEGYEESELGITIELCTS